MSLASFGVQRLLRFILTNSKIKSKRETFFLLDFLLQAALVGNILWIIMFITKDVSSKNYFVLVFASLAAGIVSSYLDTSKIFSRNSKFKPQKPDSSDTPWLIFYAVFAVVYFTVTIVMAVVLF